MSVKNHGTSSTHGSEPPGPGAREGAKGPGRRDRSRPRDTAKAETRDALINAGIAAFAAEGLDAPSLDSICERAGYTRGAFYVHFKDREEFLIAVMGHIFERFLDTIIATGDAAIDLQKTIQLFAAAIENGLLPVSGEVPLHQFLAACARSPKVRERFVSVLGEAATRVAAAAREGQEAGTIRADVSADHVGSILLAIALGVQCMTEVDYPLSVVEATSDVARLLKP